MTAGAVTATVRVRDLRVELLDGTDVIDEVSFSIDTGQLLAIVGESGSGKTATALAMLGYARPGSRIAAGEIRIGDTDLLGTRDRALRRLRGSVVSYVPQDPSTALNPSHRIGAQVAEMFDVHEDGTGDARERVGKLLELVQLPSDRQFQRRYPHQLSGGQQQRVAIAMALACRPKLVVLDEPTTGLDVTTQRRILAVIDELRRTAGVALLYITHDLSVVAEIADRVAVLYGGRIVEMGSRDDAFAAPRHPYTLKLIRSIPRVERPTRLLGIPGTAVAPGERPDGCPFEPRCDFATDECRRHMPSTTQLAPGHGVRCHHWRRVALAVPAEPVAQTPAISIATETAALVVEDLVAGYGGGRSRGGGAEPAVRGVSFNLGRQECLAIVGESGSGKTTLARCLAGLHAPSSGQICFEGQPLAALARERPLEVRRRIQIVFQNPDASLNPRQTVNDIVTRPAIQFFGMDRRRADLRAAELFELVRLPAALSFRYPRELSGGEKQRVAIARALAAEPALVICDEITSALDVSVQAAILDLLNDLRRRLSASFLFISHNLAAVRSIADRIAVLNNGVVCEIGQTEQVFSAPQADYTGRLLAAAPTVAPQRRVPEPAVVSE